MNSVEPMPMVATMEPMTTRRMSAPGLAGEGFGAKVAVVSKQVEFILMTLASGGECGDIADGQRLGRMWAKRFQQRGDACSLVYQPTLA